MFMLYRYIYYSKYDFLSVDSVFPRVYNIMYLCDYKS